MGSVIVEGTWSVPPSLLPPNDWPEVSARLDRRSQLEGYDDWGAFLRAFDAEPSPVMFARYHRITA